MAFRMSTDVTGSPVKCCWFMSKLSETEGDLDMAWPCLAVRCMSQELCRVQ